MIPAFDDPTSMVELPGHVTIWQRNRKGASSMQKGLRNGVALFFNSPGLKIQSIQETGANQPNHLPPNSASKMSAQPYDTRDQVSSTEPLGNTPYPNYSRQAGSRRQPDTPEGNQGTDGSFTQEA